MKKINQRKNKNLILIISIIFLIALVILCVYILATLQNTNKENNSNKTHDLTAQLTVNENIRFAENELKEIENTYLSLFIYYNENNSNFLNNFATALAIKSQNNSSYSTYTDDPTAIIYDKELIDSALSEMLGQNSKSLIASLYDSTNEVYVTHNDYYSTGYKITSSESNIEKGIVTFDVEYCDYSNEDYNKFESEYISTHDTSKYAVGEGVDSALSEEIDKEFEASREKKKVQIKVTKNETYSYSKYRLLSIENK